MSIFLVEYENLQYEAPKYEVIKPLFGILLSPFVSKLKQFCNTTTIVITIYTIVSYY